MSVILIFGDEQEPQTGEFANNLRHRGADVQCLMFSDFPDKLSVSWSPENNSGVLHLTHQDYCFSKIKSVYWHKTVSAEANNNYLGWFKEEVRSALSPFLHCNTIRWVNGLNAIQYHANKPRQLSHAVRLGAHIPPTYIGNNSAAAASFLETYAECIYKPVQGSSITKRVLPQQRSEQHLSRTLKTAPITLQAMVGCTNVRTYVIGNNLYSAELAPHASDLAAKIISLPPHVAALAHRICRGFQMLWCAIEWRRDDKGNYYFLEANPCPHFTHFENQTALPIQQQLANLLVH